MSVNAMQIRQEIKEIVRSAAEPRQPGDMIKSIIARSARRIGLPYWRAYHFWYGHRDAWAYEADQIRAWRRAKEEHEEQVLAADLANLKARLDAVNAAEAMSMDAAVSPVERRERRKAHRVFVGVERRKTPLQFSKGTT